MLTLPFWIKCQLDSNRTSGKKELERKMALDHRCRQQCRFPWRTPFCKGLCEWQQSHEGMCACDEHVENPQADPLTELTVSGNPAKINEVGAPTEFPSPALQPSDSFGGVVNAVLERGLTPQDARAIWTRGVRNAESVARVTIEVLRQSRHLPAGQQLQVLEEKNAGTRSGSIRISPLQLLKTEKTIQ